MCRAPPPQKKKTGLQHFVLGSFNLCRIFALIILISSASPDRARLPSAPRLIYSTQNSIRKHLGPPISPSDGASAVHPEEFLLLFCMCSSQLHFFFPRYILSRVPATCRMLRDAGDSLQKEVDHSAPVSVRPRLRTVAQLCEHQRFTRGISSPAQGELSGTVLAKICPRRRIRGKAPLRSGSSP